MDIASVLQMKAGLEIIEDQIQSLRQILAGLAIKYRDTPHGWSHPSAARTTDHIWIQSRGVLIVIRPTLRAITTAQAEGPLGAIWWRRRNACFSW
jgi:hypothetical protein